MKLKYWPTAPNVVYTDKEAEGAIPNNTLIVKRNSEPGDAHQDGVKGMVIGSMEIDAATKRHLPEAKDIKHLYFVLWEGLDVPVGVSDVRIKIL